VSASIDSSIRAANRATPAERAVKFHDEQVRLKQEATDRRAAAAERLSVTRPRQHGPAPQGDDAPEA
jgi:hypothetical protein